MCVSLKNSLGLNLPLFSLPVAAVSVVYGTQSHEPCDLLLLQSGWGPPSHVAGARRLHCLRTAQVPGQVRGWQRWPREIFPPAWLWKDSIPTKPAQAFFRHQLFRLCSSFRSLRAWDDQWEMATQAVMGLKWDADASLGARAWVRSCVLSGQRQWCQEKLHAKCWRRL